MSRSRGTEHAPMEHFPSEDGELLVGGVKIRRLAARVGRTPFYAYDRGLLTQRAVALRQLLHPSVELHYAMKANPLPALVGHMVGLVGGIDVASGGELKVALDAGADPEHVSFAGPAKSATELHQAVAAGVLVNLESTREIPLLARASESLGVAARVAVRVNPDFELKLAGMRMGGGPKQFGLDAEEVPAVLAQIRDAGLTFEGFQIFAGSQNLKAGALEEAQRLSFELAARLAGRAPGPVKWFNLGGGFGVPYFPGDQPLSLEAVTRSLNTVAERAAAEFPGVRVVLELGRFLVAEAGVYVCRILDRKVSRGHVFYVTDGGLHHNLAASGNFGQVVRKNYPVAVATRMDAGETSEASVVGPLCTPLDLLADRMELASAEEGDLVAVFQAGAYGATASPGAFLSHPDVVEVLV